jgi:hypothetical protein
VSLVPFCRGRRELREATGLSWEASELGSEALTVPWGGFLSLAPWCLGPGPPFWGSYPRSGLNSSGHFLSGPQFLDL